MDPAAAKDDVQKQLALERAQWHADLAWLLNDAAGKRIVRWFIREAQKRPFTSDERTTSYNLGRQELLRDFIEALRAADISAYHAAERMALEKKS